MENEDSLGTSESDSTKYILDKTFLSVSSQHKGDDSTTMQDEDCGSSSSSNSMSEHEQGNTLNLLEVTPLNPHTLFSKHSDTKIENHSAMPSTLNTKLCPVKVPVNLNNDLSDETNLMIKRNDCSSSPFSRDVTPCSVDVSIAIPDKTNEEGSVIMDSESCDIPVKTSDIAQPLKEMLPCLDVPEKGNEMVSENCGVAFNKHDTTQPLKETSSCLGDVPISKVDKSNEESSTTMNSESSGVPCNNHDTVQLCGEAALIDQEEEYLISASPSYLRLTLPVPDDLTDTSKHSENNDPSKFKQGPKKGLKRKRPSVNKGIQTSIHLLDSNSSFRDRIIDLDILKRETGVVTVENLQDLDVSLDEWPALLVSQLQLRDTIINNLHGVIREVVECGQVLEQDLDYLKLKTLELQQESKKAKEQRNHKTVKEMESQTTEEDFSEAWSRWYYGRWGDYYSESDPTSSMYWPGHFMKESTVAYGHKETKEEETEKTAEVELEITDKLQELNRKKCVTKKKKSKYKDSSHGKSYDSEKIKKLKGKGKERYKKDKSREERTGIDEDDEEVRNYDKSHKKKKKEDKRRKRKKEKRNSNSQVKEASVSTQLSQDEATSVTFNMDVNGSEKKESEPQGWDTSQSITQQVATVAAQAVAESGYIFQEELGLYYDYNTGYYYNAESGLYYDTKTGTYFYYDHATQSYQFHSQVSPTTTNDKSRSCKKKTSKKKGTKSSSKNEDTEEREDGECSDSDGGGDYDTSEESEEENNAGGTNSPSHQEEEITGIDIPPSLRLMVVEGGEKVRVGELHVVTLNGGTVGRETTNDVHLPDLNVSKVHAEIEYRSTGPEDHHYFLRDLGSNNGTFVNGTRLSEARQTSNQVEVGHGWEVQFGPIKIKCHLHPGNLTCNECEPGLVLHGLSSDTLKSDVMTSFKNAKSKEKARRKELKAMQKKYKLTHHDSQPSSAPAPGYTDRTFLRQVEKGSDNPYEKTEVACTEMPLKETNRGFTLLQKMGWSKGEGLGRDKSGITEPVQPVSVVGQAGFGSSQPFVLSTIDPREERRRKLLQITQERYKHSTGGH